MKRLALAALALIFAAASGRAQNFSAEDLARRTVERRAVEAVIWGMPAVNYDLMYQEMVRKVKGSFNQVLYWSRLLDWKNQTLTPNPDVIYLMPFFNTKDVGPVVLEIPPADDGVFNGSIMNYWQAAHRGCRTGRRRQGQGRQIPHPAARLRQGQVPDGYIAMPSDTYQGYALLRSVLKSGSDADVAKAVAYAKRIKLYPLSQAANPPPTVFVDASDVVFDSTIPYDLRFFESLNRDRAGRAVAGTRQGDDRPAQDHRHRERQAVQSGREDASRSSMDAIQEAKAWLDSRYDTLPPYYEGERWFFPIDRRNASRTS